MEPLERRYFGDDTTSERSRRRRREPELGWPIGPGAAGAGDLSLAPGPHADRGPRDARRTDDRLRDDVGTWMAEDARLDARGIVVHVEDGVVTLEGGVAGASARRLAQDIAAAVPGVRLVVNRLTTRPTHTRRSA